MSHPIRALITMLTLASAACGSEPQTTDQDQDNDVTCANGTRYQNGRCVPVTPPPSWTCAATDYGTVNGCDCGCGFADPDCVLPLVVAGCTRDHCDGTGTPNLLDPTSCDAGNDIWVCDIGYLGDGSCDCGCGAQDTDCPTPTVVSDCAYESCPDNQTIDPSNPAHCVAAEAPADWTCDAAAYGNGACDCGCGIRDEDCAQNATIYDCLAAPTCGSVGAVDANDLTKCKTAPTGWTCDVASYNEGTDYGTCDCGCGIVDPDCGPSPTLADCPYYGVACTANQHLDPEDVTQCLPNPAGWTCDGSDLIDGQCTCGCGLVDPDCPTPLTFHACGDDGCPYGKNIDPMAPTTCIADAPQRDWGCDKASFFDGATCDCGCGTLDLDCPANATVADCAVTHCTYGTELKPGSVTTCIEHCEPMTGIGGTGTCTNGGMVEIFGNCNYHLSACGDAHSYEVECDSYGTCYCRVDSSCVLATTGSCMGLQTTLNTVCGWSLVDNRY